MPQRLALIALDRAHGFPLVIGALTAACAHIAQAVDYCRETGIIEYMPFGADAEDDFAILEITLYPAIIARVTAELEGPIAIEHQAATPGLLRRFGILTFYGSYHEVDALDAVEALEAAGDYCEAEQLGLPIYAAAI